MLKLDYVVLKSDVLALSGVHNATADLQQLMMTRVTAPTDLHLVIGLFHGRISLCKYVRYDFAI
jgi:hypothetical protein